MEIMKAYFKAERSESLLFMVIGTAAIIVALYFYLNSKDLFYRGMAIPLAMVALIQLTVGYTVWVRSPKDAVRVEGMLTAHRSDIMVKEIPRMQTVMKNFLVYRYVEIVLMGVGLLLLFVFSDQAFIKGVGLGLFIQSALMLTLDVFAEKRGSEYLDWLIHL